MAAINGLFSTFGFTAKTKVLVLDSSVFSSAGILNQARSLKNFEHVSPAGLMRQEISRRQPSRGSADGDATLALLRRWFFARKPDAGFILLDFPATLLQALVFDEWLDARDETLSGVFAGRPDHPAVEHYRTLGLLVEEAGVAVP